MSDIIIAKIKTKEELFSKKTSTSLFDIVKHACERKIALTFFQKCEGIENIFLSQIDIGNNEILLGISDSYNRVLSSPLIGSSMDYEVKEYRDEPLLERLMNLQGLFEFIIKQEDVLQVDLLLTSDDLRFDNEVLPVKLNDFATYLEPLIECAQFPSFHYQFIWIK